MALQVAVERPCGELKLFSLLCLCLHPCWLCKERQRLLLPLQLTLENSPLFLDHF